MFTERVLQTARLLKCAGRKKKLDKMTKIALLKRFESSYILDARTEYEYLFAVILRSIKMGYGNITADKIGNEIHWKGSGAMEDVDKRCFTFLQRAGNKEEVKEFF